MNYTNNLKAIRIQQGLTLRQVATKMNMQCEFRVSQWENNVALPSISNRLKLCEIYAVDSREVFSLPHLESQITLPAAEKAKVPEYT